MNKYTIAIEETVIGEFEITAENETETLRSVEDKYKRGDIVLCPGELQFKQMAVVPSSGEITEWHKF